MIAEKKVLDHGYVRLVTWSPHNMMAIMAAVEANDLDELRHLVKHNDLAEVNAARASYGSESSEFGERDAKLVKFLVDAEPVPHTCYDDRTEVFTDRGWVRWPDVTMGDKIAAVRPNGTAVFEEPLRLVSEPYKGLLYAVNHAHASIRVTPSHRMWVARRKNGGFHDFGFQSATEVARKAYRLQTGAVFEGGDYGTYNEGFLYGFFLGDGAKRDRGQQVTFHLRKVRKIAALKAAVNALDLPMRVTVQKDGTTEIAVTVTEAWFRGKAKDKRVDTHVFLVGSARYREGVFDGLLQSDGSKKRGAWVFGSTSKGLVDDFIRLGTLLGRYVKPNSAQHGLHKAMVLSRSVSPRVNDADDNKDAWEEYEGVVYCAEVSTGLLLVRRSGTITVSGNSPFRHSHITMEINAPLPVARQWWRHAIGGGTTEDGTPWSELSRRYVRGGVFYHLPSVYRSAPEQSKQGSGPPLHPEIQTASAHIFKQSCDNAMLAYDRLLGLGVATEQARMVLPQGVFTSWRWSPSLQSLANFLVHRLAPDAQSEIREYAKAVHELVQPLFPHAIDAFVPPLG